MQTHTPTSHLWFYDFKKKGEEAERREDNIRISELNLKLT